MSKRLALALMMLGLAAFPARAEPTLTLLSLPFAAKDLRGPDSAVAVAVATDGEARDAGVPRDATLAVAWGEAGAAALVAGDPVRTGALPASTVEGALMSETPRDAPAGARRVRRGALSVQLSADGAVVIAERQAVARSAEPKPVPVATARVEAGPGAAFAGDPVLAEFDGHPAVLAIKAGAAGASLAVIGRSEGGPWRILAETPAETAAAPGDRPEAAALPGHGIALTRGGTLQLWNFERGALALRHEASGFGPGAAPVKLDGGAALAVPTADRASLAILALDGLKERGRVALPAPAAGLSPLGRGRTARVLVRLADGRLAAVDPQGSKP